MRRAVVTFFRSERQEAAIRAALDAAGAPFRETPEASELGARARASLEGFIGEVKPALAAPERRFVAEFLMTSLGAVAEEVTERERSREEIDAWAEETATMYRRYLEGS